MTVFQRTPNMALPMRQQTLDAAANRTCVIAIAETYLDAMERKRPAEQMLVADDGFGIFSRIAQAADLFDPRLAVLELAKGKYTTAPEGHSGIGIFVSSRMMDGCWAWRRASRTAALRISWRIMA